MSLAILLLALGVLAVALSCIGVLVMPTVYARLHYVGPAATLGVTFIVAAVLIEEGLSPQGMKALLIGLVLVGTSPVVTHATARAARIRTFGRWMVLPEEEEEA
jgi:multicomponent Na+:H+ antiporter subunit G